MAHWANELIENKAECNRSDQNTEQSNECFHWAGQNHLAQVNDDPAQQMRHELLAIKLLL